MSDCKTFKIGKSFKNLKTKFRDSTSTGSFVMLLLMLIGLALFDKIFCPTNILFQITIIMTSFTLLFFGSKVWRAFFSQTKFNEKGIKVYERFAELRGEGFSVMEANCIVNNEVIQENSKHQKKHHFLTDIIRFGYNFC